MMDINYFLNDAQNSRQGQFELDFAEVINCFDTSSTTLVTENGRTLVIDWYNDGTFMSYKVIYETEQLERYAVDINRVINILKEIDVDGETMQYILQRVGMSNQMMRQLMLTEDFQEVEYVWEEVRNR